MGGCATKPKVLEDDALSKAKAPKPEPEPEPTKKEDDVDDVNVAVAQPAECKEEVVAKEEPQGSHSPQVHEIVDDDQANKRRSLSLLFKKNEDSNVSKENEKPAVEEEKVGHETLEAEKPSEDSKTSKPTVKQESLKAEEKLSGESRNNEPVKQESLEVEEMVKPKMSEAAKPSGENQGNEPLKEKFVEAKEAFPLESQSKQPIKQETFEAKSSGSRGTDEPLESGKPSGEFETKASEAEKSETADVVPLVEEKVVGVVARDAEPLDKRTEETTSSTEGKNRTVVEQTSKAAEAGSEIHKS